MVKKIKIFFLLLFGLIILSYASFKPSQTYLWGVNFSIPHASFLGLDWKKTYDDILLELKPKALRTMAYWEMIEPEQDKFDFSGIDYVLNGAQEQNAKIILVVGLKQPRWPECHEPEWVKKQELGIRNQELLDYIKETIMRYRDANTIYAWQVENEPFFPYGPDCGSIPRDLFKQELELVKSLDPRPIIVTDSGEKGAWVTTAWVGGDIFGSTMYREIYNDKKQKYLKYPIPPQIYRLRAGFVKLVSDIDEFVGVELQAEPWFAATGVHETSWEEQVRHMNPEIFEKNVNYARKAGFGENYFWGVEWWYWAKSHGHAEMWEAAKQIFNSQ